MQRKKPNSNVTVLKGLKISVDSHGATVTENGKTTHYACEDGQVSIAGGVIVVSNTRAPTKEKNDGSEIIKEYPTRRM